MATSTQAGSKNSEQSGRQTVNVRREGIETERRGESRRRSVVWTGGTQAVRQRADSVMMLEQGGRHADGELAGMQVVVMEVESMQRDKQETRVRRTGRDPDTMQAGVQGQYFFIHINIS